MLLLAMGFCPGEGEPEMRLAVILLGMTLEFWNTDKIHVRFLLGLTCWHFLAQYGQKSLVPALLVHTSASGQEGTDHSYSAVDFPKNFVVCRLLMCSGLL